MLPRSTSPSTAPFADWRDNDQKSTRKRNFNTWKVGQYVSLVDGFGYWKALTIYCLPHSVCGIAFHDILRSRAKPVLLGAQNPAAVALHIEMDTTEKLRHILVDLDALGTAGTWGQDHCPPFMVSELRNCS